MRYYYTTFSQSNNTFIINIPKNIASMAIAPKKNQKLEQINHNKNPATNIIADIQSAAINNTSEV